MVGKIGEPSVPNFDVAGAKREIQTSFFSSNTQEIAGKNLNDVGKIFGKLEENLKDISKTDILKSRLNDNDFQEELKDVKKKLDRTENKLISSRGNRFWNWITGQSRLEADLTEKKVAYNKVIENINKYFQSIKFCATEQDLTSKLQLKNKFLFMERY